MSVIARLLIVAVAGLGTGAITTKALAKKAKIPPPIEIPTPPAPIPITVHVQEHRSSNITSWLAVIISVFAFIVAILEVRTQKDATVQSGEQNRLTTLTKTALVTVRLWGDDQYHGFRFRNVGNAPVLINQIQLPSRGVKIRSGKELEAAPSLKQHAGIDIFVSTR